MKNVRMAGVAFFLLMMQLVCLSVKADNKADYLKLAQKVRQEVWDNTPVYFKKRAVPEKFGGDSILLQGTEYRLLSQGYDRVVYQWKTDTPDRLRGYGAYADTNQRQESPEGLFRILFSYKIEEMAGRISSYDQYHLGNSCVEERRHGAGGGFRRLRRCEGR